MELYGGEVLEVVRVGGLWCRALDLNPKPCGVALPAVQSKLTVSRGLGLLALNPKT